MIEKLRHIWKETQIKMATSELLGSPSYKVTSELEKEGWKFEVNPIRPPMLIGIGMGAAASISYTKAYTPEGQLVTYDNKAVHKRYKMAKRSAAERIYAPK
jgi:hypothetical protein